MVVLRRLLFSVNNRAYLPVHQSEHLLYSEASKLSFLHKTQLRLNFSINGKFLFFAWGLFLPRILRAGPGVQVGTRWCLNSQWASRVCHKLETILLLARRILYQSQLLVVQLLLVVMFVSWTPWPFVASISNFLTISMAFLKLPFALKRQGI